MGVNALYTILIGMPYCAGFTFFLEMLVIMATFNAFAKPQWHQG
jgi:hypothetical protein